MAQGYEKRESHRVPLDTKVQYSADGLTWHQSRSRDVSSTGIQLQIQDPVQPGNLMKLSFTLPNLKWQEPVQAEAEVVRVINQKGHQLGVGLRFISLRANHYQAVEEFISRVLGIHVEEGFERLGDRPAGGGFVFSMDRLATESVEKKAEALEKKMLVQAREERREAINLALNRAGRVALLIVVGYLAFKVAGFFVELFFKLSELAQ
jgi:hypothetical protein